MHLSFYYIRHGMTDANIDRRFCGSEWDLPLNDQGRMEAQQTLLSMQNLACVRDIQTVCFSPMLRARQTKDIIAPALPKAQFVEMNDLREWSFGSWSGKLVNEMISSGTDIYQSDPPGGETHSAFRTRVTQTFQSCMEKEKAVLIVAHGAFGSMLMRTFGVVVPFENATLYRVDLGAEPRITKLNDPRSS